MRGKSDERGRAARSAVGALSRIILSGLGALLVIWGVGTPLVALTGAEAKGRVTHVRRMLGDRGEAIPNRYAYAIAYEFRLPSGALQTGTDQRVGDFFSPGRLGIGSSVTVNYVSFAPALSVMEWRLGALLENIMVAGAGVLLLRLNLKSR